jgi:carbonic anhydrase/acetyltransferase-like protein (isoleucine patch superfamily)
MSLTKLDASNAGPTGDVTIAPSARVLGSLRIGVGVYIAQGAVVRSLGEGVELGSRSALLENGVVIGSPELPVRIGQKTVFGHRCLVIGATVGDLCEIGNGSIMLPGAVLGRRCFLGEGTLVPPGMAVPDDTVLVGRPARVLRHASPADRERLVRLRSGDLSVPDGPP